MALTGLQIQKLLPGTNCRECGSNTCLAFAMKLAAKKASLAECPTASDEAKRILGEASEPPVKTLQLGQGGALAAGGETVLYRHEKTFVNQTLIGVAVRESDNAAAREATLAAVAAYRFERVGEIFGIDLVALQQTGTDPAAFAALAAKVHAAGGKALVIEARDAVSLAAAAKAVAGSGSILCADAAVSDDAAALAKEHGHALALTAPDLNALTAAVGRLREKGFANILLRFATHSLAEQFQVNTIARRAAIKDGAKAAGFPFLRFIDAGSGLTGHVQAATEIVKYGGVVILPAFDPAAMASLMTLRMNIYTDPQKPIQVEPNLYPIGEPGPASPLFVTTNFSLTYFIVSGEIENSGVSAWLMVPDCDGMSVLTAWAAGKFNAAVIAKFVKEHELEQKLTSRDIFLPGYVAQISGELEEELPGWKAVPGPGEAADIESFVKARGLV